MFVDRNQYIEVLKKRLEALGYITQSKFEENHNLIFTNFHFDKLPQTETENLLQVDRNSNGYRIKLIILCNSLNVQKVEKEILNFIAEFSSAILMRNLTKRKQRPKTNIHYLESFEKLNRQMRLLVRHFS